MDKFVRKGGNLVRFKYVLYTEWPRYRGQMFGTSRNTENEELSTIYCVLHIRETFLLVICILISEAVH